MNSVAVFCGANKGAHPWFEEAAYELGKTLAERGIRVLFGGGSVGLMGVLADAVLAHNGQITGIITHQLDGLELGHPSVLDMIRVESMSERRVLLLRDTDGVITMPGGYGSMDEHFEALTLASAAICRVNFWPLNSGTRASASLNVGGTPCSTGS